LKVAPHTVRDGIAFSSSIPRLQVPAFTVLSALEAYDPALRLEAMALTIALMCQTNNLDAHELIARARRQIADAERVRSPHIEAIRDFAAGEKH
jgi:hypothetical protein